MRGEADVLLLVEDGRMPFVSEAQRKWMWANKKKMAKEWEAHTPKGKKLPERVEKKESRMVKIGSLTEFTKLAKKKMPHFAEQDRPAKAKEIYKAMKEESSDMKSRYGNRWKEVAARVAGRHGKPGKQHRGKPWKEPVKK